MAYTQVAYDSFSGGTTVRLDSRNSDLPGSVSWTADVDPSQWFATVVNCAGYFGSVAEPICRHNSVLATAMKVEGVVPEVNAWSGIGLRMDSSGNAFIAISYFDGLYIMRMDAFVRTDVGSGLHGSGMNVAGAKYSLEVDSGGTFTLRANGVSVYTYGPVSTYASNPYAGLHMFQVPMYTMIDDFKSYEDASSGALTNLRRIRPSLWQAVNRASTY